MRTITCGSLIVNGRKGSLFSASVQSPSLSTRNVVLRRDRRHRHSRPFTPIKAENMRYHTRTKKSLIVDERKRAKVRCTAGCLRSIGQRSNTARVFRWADALAACLRALVVELIVGLDVRLLGSTDSHNAGCVLQLVCQPRQQSLRIQGP